MTKRKETIRRWKRASGEYRRYFKGIDDALHALAKGREKDPSDLIKKIFIIGRTYGAGIDRHVASPTTLGRYLKLARGLGKIRDDVGTKMRTGSPADRMTAGAMLHFKYLKRLKHEGSGDQLRSFVSKYMHFIDPSMPPFDQNVAQAARDAGMKAVFRPYVRKYSIEIAGKLEKKKDKIDPHYRMYLQNFYPLYMYLKKREIPDLTVKDLDYALWSGNEEV